MFEFMDSVSVLICIRDNRCRVHIHCQNPDPQRFAPGVSIPSSVHLPRRSIPDSCGSLGHRARVITGPHYLSLSLQLLRSLCWKDGDIQGLPTKGNQGGISVDRRVEKSCWMLSMHGEQDDEVLLDVQMMLMIEIQRMNHGPRHLLKCSCSQRQTMGLTAHMHRCILNSQPHWTQNLNSFGVEIFSCFSSIMWFFTCPSNNNNNKMPSFSRIWS